MATPLYKSLKSNGTSFYCFPSAAEKISAAYQNSNNKMYFSKYVLLNFPAQNLSVGTNSAPIYFDFLDTSSQGWGFKQSNDATPPTNFSDEIIESLRNYVANYEETVRTSRLNNTDYFYDPNLVNTTAEKIFFKWAKKLNLIDFELALDGDQYIGNLPEFESKNVNDESYFPELLWVERNVTSYDIYDMKEWSLAPYSGNLYIEFFVTTNFKVGDIVEISDETYSPGVYFNGLRGKIVSSTPASGTAGQKIILDISGHSLYSSPNSFTGKVKLVYHRLVEYIGEINGISNVQESNQSYTEVYAQVSAYTGKTPDILFRTMADKNYKPNLVFPILTSQYQPEIVGAENYASPIVSNPQNYPGSYYGQFDTDDYTYTTSAGDSLRRSGEYFGISGNINSYTVDSSMLDGISIDFNPAHYTKMNIYGREITNFDAFNAMVINNMPPEDFEFNAILWYYTYEDINGNIAEDLYGISFLNNPDQNPIETETGLRFPISSKLVATDTQDGTSYDFSLDLNFNIINENPQDPYNPNAINSLYSFNLYNEAMRRLALLNDSFTNIVTENQIIKTSVSDLKQLIYTQADINSINQKIANLQELLKLYQTNQIVSSDSVQVTLSTTGTVPLIELKTIDTPYYQVTELLTSSMYNLSGAVVSNINVPDNKNSLVTITNNDQTSLILPNNNVLTILIGRDLDYKQSMDIIVNGYDTGSENKKLEIYINYSVNNNAPVITKLIGPINLPVFYNRTTNKTNSAKNWSKFNYNIDMSSPIRLNTGSILEIPINSNSKLVYNSINTGDTLTLNNFSIGTASLIDFSDQYRVKSVGATNSYVYLDVSTNKTFNSYGSTASLPIIFNDTNNWLLSNNPYIGLNKGYKFKITRVDETISSSIQDRYLIETEVK